MSGFGGATKGNVCLGGHVARPHFENADNLVTSEAFGRRLLLLNATLIDFTFSDTILLECIPHALCGYRVSLYSGRRRKRRFSSHNLLLLG